MPFHCGPTLAQVEEGAMSKPSFSNPDVSPLSVTPGVTPAEKNAARYVRFIDPPEQDGPEWYHEDDERL